MLKKFIKQILYRIDFFKAPILLRSKQEPRVSTIAFGIFSLLLFILFAYVFIRKAINIVNTDSSEIKSSGYLQRSQNTTYAKNMMFSLGIDYQYLTSAEFSDYFQLYAYTANSTEVVQGFAKWNKIQMVPCNKQLWSLVSVDVEKYYPFQSYYCLPSVSSSITVQYDKNFLKIQLLKCTTKPTCKSSSEIDQLVLNIINSNNFFPIYVGYLNSYPQLTQPNALKYAVQTAIYFTTASTIQKVFLKFDQLKIKTDTSYWPIYSNVQESQALTFSESYYAFQEKNSLNNNSFIKIQLSLTNNEIVYQRNITKMDDALSYVGGLHGLVVFILIFLLKSYNEYKYELHVAENSFNYDNDGYKIREEDLGMFKYLRYRLYFIIFLVFGKKLKWGDCPEMQETIYEAKKLLDVEGMYRRLDMMERAVWYRFDFNCLLMDTLQKPYTIQQVNKKRRTMQYYQQVIHMQNAATVQDAVKKDSKSFKYLDESNRKLSKKRTSIYSLLNKMSLNNAENQDVNENGDVETELQIERSLKQDLNLHEFEQQCASISNYPLIYLQAKEMELDEQYDQIEEQITQSFKNLSYDSKKKLLSKIPMKILHRLRLRAVKMNKQKKQREKKEQNLEQGQKNEANKFIREDRDLSLENLNSQDRMDTGNSINHLKNNKF